MADGILLEIAPIRISFDPEVVTSVAQIGLSLKRTALEMLAALYSD